MDQIYSAGVDLVQKLILSYQIGSLDVYSI